MNTLIQTSPEQSRTRILRKTFLAFAVVLALTVGRVNAQIPMLTWAPETSGAYDYGTVTVGQPVSQLFTLTNNGGSASAALTISLSGSPSFTVISDGCSATSLGPRKSCGVVVQFAPTNSGQVTATLTANGRKPEAIANLTLIGSSGATRHVYWSTPIGAIGRADVEGGNVNQNFITGALYARGVAVDGSHIYWVSYNNGTIGRADLDGQNVNQSFITDAYGPWGMAVDGSHIYWANRSAIGRADLDGQNVNQSFISVSFPFGVAVNSSHIYWTNYFGGTIGRADPDGGNMNESFVTGASNAIGMAVDSNHIYWADYYNNTIGRADLDGGNVNPSFITGASFPYEVAVDSRHIYWTNSGRSTIGRADLDGQNVNQSFVTGAFNATGIAVDLE